MENENMTFTVSNDYGEFGGKFDMSITINRDSTLDEVLKVFERMALALTYQPASLISAYRERLEEHEGIARLTNHVARASRNA